MWWILTETVGVSILALMLLSACLYLLFGRRAFFLDKRKEAKQILEDAVERRDAEQILKEAQEVYHGTKTNQGE